MIGGRIEPDGTLDIFTSMRVLVHPAAEDITLEAVLYALADPVRLRIFANLTRSGSACPCSAYLTVDGQEIPKSTLSKHFRVLREHGLIRSERRGVEMLSVPRTEEIEARFPGVLGAILGAVAG